MQSRGAISFCLAHGLDVSKRENLQECVYSTNYVASQPPPREKANIYARCRHYPFSFLMRIIGGLKIHVNGRVHAAAAEISRRMKIPAFRNSGVRPQQFILFVYSDNNIDL